MCFWVGLVQMDHIFEQVQVAVPVILKVLKDVFSESEDESIEPLFESAIGIADSICAICSKLVS